MDVARGSRGGYQVPVAGRSLSRVTSPPIR
jgi:hypothetical protein